MAVKRATLCNPRRTCPPGQVRSTVSYDNEPVFDTLAIISLDKLTLSHHFSALNKLPRQLPFSRALEVGRAPEMIGTLRGASLFGPQKRPAAMVISPFSPVLRIFLSPFCLSFSLHETDTENGMNRVSSIVLFGVGVVGWGGGGGTALKTDTPAWLYAIVVPPPPRCSTASPNPFRIISWVGILCIHGHYLATQTATVARVYLSDQANVANDRSFMAEDFCGSFVGAIRPVNGFIQSGTRRSKKSILQGIWRPW